MMDRHAPVPNFPGSIIPGVKSTRYTVFDTGHDRTRIFPVPTEFGACLMIEEMIINGQFF